MPHDTPPLKGVREQIAHCLCTRVPGTAVFIASSPDHVPPILVHFVEALHPFIACERHPAHRTH